MKTAAGYLRLSKWDQDTTSPQRQRAAIRKLARERGWELREPIYEDIDVSGWNGHKRPGLESMLSDLAGVHAVIVYRLDRLARSQQEFARILAALDDLHVELVATDMTFENTPTGTFTRDLVARLAQLESDTISARSRSVVAFKREKGEPLGAVPYGWKRNGKGFEPDPGEQRILRDAARRYVKGESFNEIAQSIGKRTTTVNRWLRSARVQDAFPESLRGDLLQALAARRAQRVPEHKLSLLGGIARCADCGDGMAYSGGRRYSSYKCPVRSHTAITARFLEPFVTEQVLAAIDPAKLTAAVKARRKAGKTPAALQIEARIEMLDTMLVEGRITRPRYEKMNAALIEKLAEAKQAAKAPGLDITLDLAKNLRERWPDLNVPERRRVIAAVIERLEIAKGATPSPDRVTITWR